LILKLRTPVVNVSKFTGGKFCACALHECWILKLKDQTNVKISECWILKLKDQTNVKNSKFTGGKFFVNRLHHGVISKLKEHPSVNISKFTGGKFFVYCTHTCWLLKLKGSPKCKNQQGFIVCTSVGKNQQVCRWLFFCYRLHDCLMLKLKRNPSEKISKFTGGNFYWLLLAEVLESQAKRSPKYKNQ
jgi:hypothetical protein